MLLTLVCANPLSHPPPDPFTTPPPSPPPPPQPALPSFRLTPPAVVEIRLGEPARLTCDAWGRPQPVITWSKDGVALPLPLGHPAGQQYQVVNGSVVMPAVGRGATGVYTCRARNAEGTIAHSSTLLVM
ncbi:hypothetical protein chiPu_0022983, partial [Chiloscyllium punctatum]|nr:hypothetical protein [Chiloscyllium punctatum]